MEGRCSFIPSWYICAFTTHFLCIFDDFDDFVVVNGKNHSKMCSFDVTCLTSLPLKNKPGVISLL